MLAEKLVCGFTIVQSRGHDEVYLDALAANASAALRGRGSAG